MPDTSPQPATKPAPAVIGNGAASLKKAISSETKAAASTATSLQTMFASYNGGGASGRGFQDLMKAYQTLARRNSEKLTDSINALKAIKSPQEFVELQQKFLSESIAAAIEDGKMIGELTTAAFTAAFEPMRAQIGGLQAGTKRQE